MCYYTDILGSGGSLLLQLLTAVSIFLSIWLWILIYRWQNVSLRQYTLPIVLWMILGTSDILITAKGTYDNPFREENPLARFIFVMSGTNGPVVASTLWIALWSALALLINRKLGERMIGPIPVAQFLSLAIFYSLAVGHLYGFSSWFAPMCGVARLFSFIPEIPGLVKIILVGSTLAAVHACIVHNYLIRKGQI